MLVTLNRRLSCFCASYSESLRRARGTDDVGSGILVEVLGAFELDPSILNIVQAVARYINAVRAQCKVSGWFLIFGINLATGSAGLTACL